ncbi:hypothetical protein, partial [Atlantibacter sp.]|uniref:hypothetical protein n=1 Tax=Atlantibacter sp. TaxID=1903473 RepID=UPI0028AF4256
SHPARPTNVKKRPKGAFLLSAIYQCSQVLIKPADITVLATKGEHNDHHFHHNPDDANQQRR